MGIITFFEEVRGTPTSFVIPISYYINGSMGEVNMKLGKNAKDLTGQTFKKLMAIKPIIRSERGEIIWECICECGNITNVTASHLISHNTTSCGCNRTLLKKDLLNRTFGAWIVIKEIGRHNNGCIIWLCRCECGTEKGITSSVLLNGSSRSCGCKRNKKLRDMKILSEGEAHRNSIFDSYKRNSKKCGREFFLLLEDFI